MKTIAIAVAALSILVLPSIAFAEYDGTPTNDYADTSKPAEAVTELGEATGPGYDTDLDREDTRLPRIISERGSKNVNPVYDPTLPGSIYRNQGVVETDDSVGRPINPETFGHGKKVAKTHGGKGVAAIRSNGRRIKGYIHSGGCGEQ